MRFVFHMCFFVFLKATADEKVDATLDILGGGATLVGGSFGAGFAGGVLGLKAGIGILRKGYQFKQSLISIDLQKAFRTMENDGMDLALFGNRVIAASKLLENEKDPQVKSDLEAEYRKFIRVLTWKLASVFEQSTRIQKRPSQPGYWTTLRLRFRGAELVSKVFGTLSPVNLLVKKTEIALFTMGNAFKDFETILEEESTKYH